MKRYCREYPDPGEYAIVDGSKSKLIVYDEPAAGGLPAYRVWHRTLCTGQEFIAKIKVSHLGFTPLELHHFEEMSRRLADRPNDAPRFGAPSVQYAIPGAAHKNDNFDYASGRTFETRKQYDAYMKENGRVDMSGNEFKYEIAANREPKGLGGIEKLRSQGYNGSITVGREAQRQESPQLLEGADGELYPYYESRKT